MFLLKSITLFIFRNRYRKEMISVISIKLIALILIWGFFFSHPVTRHLKSPDLIDHFITASAESTYPRK